MDIASRSSISSIQAHRDSVTGIQPLDSGNIWVSSSMDSTLKIWNFSNSECISSLDCPGPVTHLAIRNGRIFAAIGESVLVVDVQTPTSIVANFVAHTRSIIGLAIVRSNLVTASSDRTLKVFDPSSFALLHTTKFHSDVTAFDVRPDASAIAIGLAGGVVQLKFAVIEKDVAVTQKIVRMPANFRLFQREAPRREAAWNRALRKFNVADALDLVLATEDAAEIVGMVDELDRLGRLDAAIAGRDAEALRPLLAFLVGNAVNPVWSHVVLKAVVSVEKIYRAVIVDDPTVGGLFEALVKVINGELETQVRAAKLIGQIDLLLSNSVY
jgi:U3 small nucleolar RNA-associated protein 15